MRLRIPINDGVASAGASAPLGVQVLIPAALNRPTHTLYSICMSVQPTLQEWTVNRRYSQFLTLRDDLITTLVGGHNGRNGCPACASFALALHKFPFPRKTLMRTDRSVRKRVKALEGFLQLLVQRLFNDLPKCHICGEQVKKMVRPFLIRGAQPIGDSTPSKIQHSLSLQSYAIVKHKPRNVDVFEKDSGKKAPMSNSSNESYATTHRTGSDPSFDDHGSERDSPTEATVDFAASTMSEDAYGKQFDVEPRCTDTPIALEEALKQVVIIDKRKNTLEEIAFRLSSMWDAYDEKETLAAAPQLGIRLSNTLEEGSEDGMGVDEMPREDVFDEDDDVIHMLEDNENNLSFALLEDEFILGDEMDEETRETLAVDTVSYQF